MLWIPAGAVAVPVTWQLAAPTGLVPCARVHIVNVSELPGVLVSANEIVPAGVKTVPPVAVSCTLTVNVAVPPTTAVPVRGEIVVVVGREFTTMLVTALLFFQLLGFALYCSLMVPFPL